MAEFKPSFPYATPVYLLETTYTSSKGAQKKERKKIPSEIIDDKNLFYCSFKTYGGSEGVVNGLYAIEDTATVETFYREDIKADSAIVVLSKNAEYEVIGEPENVNMLNKFLKFKVKRIKGGA